MKLGDIVIYHLWKTPEGRLEFPNNNQLTAPAIVVNAWEDTPGGQHYVNIRVIQDGSETPVWRTSVNIGTNPGQVSAKE